MRKTNGFSLLELMIALAVLTIIATVAVPKVQVWNARNRGLQAAVEILSDFSKARSVAGYTIVGDKTNGKIDIPTDVSNDGGTPMPVYIGIRLQTAMVFRAHEYAIYQKPSMKVTDWKNTATVLKKNTLPDSVFIVKVNDLDSIKENAAADDVSKRLVFTSNGFVKTQGSSEGSSAENFASLNPIMCGNEVSPMTSLIFSAVLKSKISGTENDAIWYKVDVDQAGEYHICMAFSQASTYSNSIFSGGNTLSM